MPLGRSGGLSAIWFGIEDLTAELVNKGQKPEVTLELFSRMHALKIAPMAMMMYHEGQPFYSPDSRSAKDYDRRGTGKAPCSLSRL